MFQRILGVFKLDKQVFKEIEQDASATSQAAIVVVLVAGLSAIGGLITYLMSGEGGGNLLGNVFPPGLGLRRLGGVVCGDLFDRHQTLRG